MKLLVITQKVDESDQILGFMVGWLRVLAAQVESLEVICLERGKYNLPANVYVHSLGKETGPSRVKYLFNFYRHLWFSRNKYEAVWVHMNQIYIILGWPLWRWQNKKISLWYAHGTVSWSLKLAERLTGLIFTSSLSGFRLVSKKLRVVGQGIDTEQFTFKPEDVGEPGRLVSVGRLSKIKKQAEMIANLATIKEPKWRLEIFGGPVTPADQIYTQDLGVLITKLNLSNQVILAGPVNHQSLSARLRGAEAFVTMSQTGSLDKVVLEAMAAGVIPIVLGETFKPVLGDYADVLSANNEGEWSQKVAQVLNWPIDAKQTCRSYLRSQIVNHHSLVNLMTQIVSTLANE